jgi:hypothetical protein
MRVDLTKIPVASMEASLPKGPAISPGQKSPLVVRITQADGKVLATEGAGHGKVQWKDLKLTTSIVTANQKGILALRGDPRISEGKVGHVSVAIPSQPNVRPAELDVPFRYDVAFVSNFSGSPGSSGIDGTNGMDGLNGTPSIRTILLRAETVATVPTAATAEAEEMAATRRPSTSSSRYSPALTHSCK